MVEAGDAPDMAQIGSYADYAAQDQLYKADDLLSIPVQADFVAQLADAGRSSGVQYGMPFASSTRRALLQQDPLRRGRHHPAPRPGTTWPTTPQALKAQGVKIPLRAAARPGGGAGRDHAVDAQRRGRLHRQRRQLHASTPPENVKTFTWLKDEPRRQGPDRAGRARRSSTAAAAFAAFANGRGRHAQRPPLPDEDGRAKGIEVRHRADCPAQRHEQGHRWASPTG